MGLRLDCAARAMRVRYKIIASHAQRSRVAVAIDKTRYDMLKCAKLVRNHFFAVHPLYTPSDCCMELSGARDKFIFGGLKSTT